ncbi:MAG: TlpA family protein disulfide reductase [Gammaproteobacteria bacterium]|nr:TlpA family protein disulfide reductase [Gammaproteobacteria bacterium]
MKISKTVKYGLGGVALLVAFFAGDGTMRAYLESTPGATAAKAMETTYRPGFELKDLDGKLRNANEWNGQVMVVNFWATWCPPCRKEMPAFIELQDKYGGLGLQFVGIALDDARKVEDFVDTMGVEYPVLVGQEDATAASDAYGNRLGALPYTAVVDREGTIVKTYRGEVSKASIEKLINRLL